LEDRLVETVFEAQFEFEAQMVRDLLQQAGIPARVDGAFLQSGAGELPPAGLVKVRVPLEHAKDAREIIADWEKAQPEPEAPSTAAASVATPSIGTSSTGSPLLAVARKSSWAPYTFVIGAVLGSFVAWLHFNTPVTSQGVDYDNDGKYEEQYVYDGDKMKSIEMDRNADGRPDVRYAYDSHGVVETASVDDDFDGRFERIEHLARGQPTRAETDRDGDGFNEQVAYFEHGVIETLEFLSKTTGAVVKRTHYAGGFPTYSEYDDNGDGNFERRSEYDERGDVKP
jgi:Putative prokaryotic signal transducing protein